MTVKHDPHGFEKRMLEREANQPHRQPGATSSYVPTVASENLRRISDDPNCKALDNAIMKCGKGETFEQFMKRTEAENAALFGSPVKLPYNPRWRDPPPDAPLALPAPGPAPVDGDDAAGASIPDAGLLSADPL